MEVKDLVLYQVSTDRNYKIGEKLFFNKEKFNNQGKRVFNTKFYKDEKPIYKYGFDYAESRRIIKDKNIIINLCKNLAESDFVLRELAMESVRNIFAPDAPSRLHCMFLTSRKEDVIKGVNEFHKKGFGTNFQAIAVKLNGNIFISNHGIGRQGKSFYEYINLSKSYWEQRYTDLSNADEILFEGEAEVVEIFKEVNVKRKD